MAKKSISGRSVEEIAGRGRAPGRGKVHAVETARLKGDDAGEICEENPLCLRFDVKFDRTTIKLTSIDLFDPDAANDDDVWVSVPPPYNQEADKAAKKALEKAATDGIWDIDCKDKECKCKLPKQWGDWSPWGSTEISAGFSIPAPNPPPKRLRYRANGTVNVKSRMKVGTCYRIRV